MVKLTTVFCSTTPNTEIGTAVYSSVKKYAKFKTERQDKKGRQASHRSPHRPFGNREGSFPNKPAEPPHPVGHSPSCAPQLKNTKGNNNPSTTPARPTPPHQPSSPHFSPPPACPPPAPRDIHPQSGLPRRRWRRAAGGRRHGPSKGMARPGAAARGPSRSRQVYAAPPRPLRGRGPPPTTAAAQVSISP